MLIISLIIQCLLAYASAKPNPDGVNLTVTNLYQKSVRDGSISQLWKYIRNGSAVEPVKKRLLEISCTAEFPIVWNISGYIKEPDNLEMQPYQRKILESGIYLYSLRVDVFFSGNKSESCSTFHCQSSEDPEAKKSLDVFYPGKHLFLHSGNEMAVKDSNVLPCSTTHPNIGVTLLKRNNSFEGGFENATEMFEFNPRYGFISTNPFEGNFVCNSKNESVYVNATLSRSVVPEYDYSPLTRDIKVFNTENVELECSSREMEVRIEMLNHSSGVFLFQTNFSNRVTKLIPGKGMEGSYAATCTNSNGRMIWTWDIEFVEPPKLDLNNYEGEIACSSDYPDREISSVRCVNPSQCEYMKLCFRDPSFCNYQEQKQFHSDLAGLCWRGECASLPYSHLNGILECKVKGLTKHWLFFHSLESIKLDSVLGARESALIQMDAITPILYTNITSRFFCKAAMFITADSIVFEMKFRNGSTQIMHETKNPRREHERSVQEGNFIGVLETRVPVDAVGIRCLSPVWNTSEFLIVDKSFVAKDLLIPQMQETLVTVEISASNNRLNCSSTGEPQPSYNWTKDGNEIIDGDQFQIIPGAFGESLLEFRTLDVSYLGEYKCVASNNANLLLDECKKESMDTLFCERSFATAMFHVTKVNAPDASSNVTLVILICCIILVLICVCLIFVVVWRKYLHARAIIRMLTDNEIEEFFQGNMSFVNSTRQGDPVNLDLIPYDPHFEIDISEIKFENAVLLGEGEFSRVVKAYSVPQVKDVAVKISKPSADVSLFKNMLSEIKILIYVGGHENIISFVGACTKDIKNRNVYVVVELCEQGSLKTVLRNTRKTFKNLLDVTNIESDGVNRDTVSTDVSTKSLVKWSGEIARGMEFLAYKGIVHADLAARNVLLGKNMEAKVADFGLSRKLYESDNYVKKSKSPLPWRWMALESLKTLSFSTQSDVWSYGITLWEIFTFGDIPFPHESWNDDFLDRIATGLRMGKPKYASIEIYARMVACWDEEPSNRPTFGTFRRFFFDKLAKEYLESPRMDSHGASPIYMNYSGGGSLGEELNPNHHMDGLASNEKGNMYSNCNT